MRSKKFVAHGDESVTARERWRLQYRAQRIRRRQQRERQGVYRGVRPVPIAWAHAYGSDPHRLPVPPPEDSLAWDWFEVLSRGKGRRYLLPDGTIWEYRGLDNPQAGKRSAPKGVYVGESCVETPAGWVDITADFPGPPQQLRQLRIPFRSRRPERYSREEKLRALLSIWPPDQQPELRKRVECALEVK